MAKLKDITGERFGRLVNAYHLIQFKDIMDDEEMLYNIDNGIALCERCHRDIHRRGT